MLVVLRLDTDDAMGAAVGVDVERDVEGALVAEKGRVSPSGLAGMGAGARREERVDQQHVVVGVRPRQFRNEPIERRAV